MTRKEFVKRLTNSTKDVLADFVGILAKEKIAFCIIGGLAVNAYAEPVVSLDMDAVIVVDRLTDLIKILKRRYQVSNWPNSINLVSPESDLRIQIQTDPRYQEFIKRAVVKDVLGYRLPVARPADVFQGKVWAALDVRRRPSKRQKDLADLSRLIESKPGLAKLLPATLKDRMTR